MRHVRHHLFHEFTDVIITLLQYFVCCITHSFQLWR